MNHTFEYSASEIYDNAHRVENLWMEPGDEGVRLFQGSVVENDGPGSGRSDEGPDPFTELSGDAALRKELSLDSPPVNPGRVAFIARERRGHSATLRIVVNGVEVFRPPSPIASPNARQYWELTKDEGAWTWSRWYYVDLPSGALREGANEVVLEAVDGAIGWSFMIADYKDYEKGAAQPILPETSWRRDHGSPDWVRERGEYVVRLSLNDYREAGVIEGPVVDVAGQDSDPLKRSVDLDEVRVEYDATCPEGTAVDLEARSGPVPAVDESWSAWMSISVGKLDQIAGRFLQWRVHLISMERGSSPLLKGIRIESDAVQADGRSVAMALGFNPSLRRSTWWSDHEDYGCDMLRELRSRFELDAVVAGASTEFELIERLLRWAYFIPLGDCNHYPWDVLDWLVLERDDAGDIRMNEYSQRRRDKMCLYPNVALVAALLSFGIPARHLNFHSEGMTGHEIAEAWSNDYGKWVHLDATRDFYFYDPDTRAPLDTLEVHDVLKDRLDESEVWDRPYLFRQDLDKVVKDLPIGIREGDHDLSTKDGSLFLFRSFCHFRVVPRNDTFSKPGPLPVSQGTEVWSWDGYLNWADEKVPPLLHFNGHSNRRSDFYPTLNQTRYTLEQTSDYGVKVHLETNTPCFESYLYRIDSGEWSETSSSFDWNLREGLNVIEVRSRNTAGVEGMVSSAVVRLGG